MKHGKPPYKGRKTRHRSDGGDKTHGGGFARRDGDGPRGGRAEKNDRYAGNREERPGRDREDRRSWPGKKDSRRTERPHDRRDERPPNERGREDHRGERSEGRGEKNDRYAGNRERTPGRDRENRRSWAGKKDSGRYERQHDRGGDERPPNKQRREEHRGDRPEGRGEKRFERRGERPDNKWQSKDRGERKGGWQGKRADRDSAGDSARDSDRRSHRRFDRGPDERGEGRPEKRFKKRGERPGAHFREDRRPHRDRDDRNAAPSAAASERISASLWGTHAVREAWLNPARHIRTLYVTEQALKDFQPTLQEAQEAGLERPEPKLVERDVLDRPLRDAVHQGIALDAAPLDEIFLQDLIIRTETAQKTIFVMLDHVTDPHNVGAIMRSAVAFGATGMIVQSRHAPEVTGTLAKAACGAVEHLPVACETNLSRAIETLQEAGFMVVGLDERGPEELSRLPASDKVVLVLGAEGKGLRQNLRDHCNALVRLPTGGAIQSLNVSNAAAVALYEIVRKS